MKEDVKAFKRLLRIMEELREKCPWDRKQTVDSLRNMTIEEVYELNDAIIDDEWEAIKKELGDLALHLVFYAQIGKEKNRFSISDIINEECDKLIQRHPHVYGNEQATSSEEVEKNWQAVKGKQEGRNSVLAGVPRSLPALVKALRIQKKVEQVGFEWENKEQVWKKVEEELQEYRSAQQQGKKEKEFGDILFALVNYARYEGIDPIKALQQTNKKFVKRFSALEEEARQDNIDIHNASLEKLNKLWEKVKAKD